MPRHPVPDLGSHSRENKAAFNGAFHNSPPLSLAFRCTYWILPNIPSQAELRWKCWFRPLIGQELRHSQDSQLPFLKPATCACIFLWWTPHEQRCTNQDCGPTTRPLCLLADKRVRRSSTVGSEMRRFTTRSLSWGLLTRTSRHEHSVENSGRASVT